MIKRGEWARQMTCRPFAVEPRPRGARARVIHYSGQLSNALAPATMHLHHRQSDRERRTAHPSVTLPKIAAWHGLIGPFDLRWPSRQQLRRDRDRLEAGPERSPLPLLCTLRSQAAGQAARARLDGDWAQGSAAAARQHALRSILACGAHGRRGAKLHGRHSGSRVQRRKNDRRLLQISPQDRHTRGHRCADARSS